MAYMVRLAGIDVSKERLDVHVMPSGESRTVACDTTSRSTWEPGAARWVG